MQYSEDAQERLGYVRSIAKNADYILQNYGKSRRFREYDNVKLKNNISIKVPNSGGATIRNKHGHEIAIPSNTMVYAVKSLSDNRLFTDEFDMDSLKFMTSKVQKIADVLSKEIGRSSSSGSNKQQQQSQGNQKTKAKQKGKAKDPSKDGVNDGADSTKDVKPYTDEQYSIAQRLFNDILKDFPPKKAKTWEKDYKRMIPFIYSNLSELAPRKIDRVMRKVLIVFQKAGSGYMSGFENGIILAMKDIVRKSKYPMLEYDRLYYDVVKSIQSTRLRIPHAVVTSGCSNGESPATFLELLKKSDSKVYTHFREGNNCGCSTLYLCKEHRIKIQHSFIESVNK